MSLAGEPQFEICLFRPGERSEHTTFEVFIKQLRCNRNLTGHNGAYRFILLFSFQLSFFLWTTLSLFLMFLFAFVFLSLIAHVCFFVIENECSALRFLLFKPGTPRPVTRQVPLHTDGSSVRPAACSKSIYISPQLLDLSLN